MKTSSIHRTGIPYLTHHWPIATGCLSDKPCWQRCWARAMAHRFGRDFTPTFHPDLLADPLRLRGSGRVVGVAFGGDLFVEGIADGQIECVFSIVALARDQKFVLLTKRPERMTAFLQYGCRAGFVAWAAWMDATPEIKERFDLRFSQDGSNWPGWPLPNVYLGFSAWDQESFDAGWRAMAPLAAAGWRVWCSLEPMIGPVDVSDATDCGHETGCQQGWQPEPGIAGIILGAESGPGARPLDLAWVRTVRDQCRAASVPFSYKQGAGDGLPTHRDMATGQTSQIGHCGEGLQREVEWMGRTATVPVLDGDTHTATAWEV